MKLWHAILWGSRRRKQATDTLFRKAFDGSVYTCALGAAYEGVTGEVCWDSNHAYHYLRKTFPVLDKHARCPVRGCPEPMLRLTLGCIIIHLNDAHSWSRERISIEVVKPQEEQAKSASRLEANDLPTAA